MLFYDDDDTVKFWNRLGLKAKAIGQRDKAKQFYMPPLKCVRMSLLLVEQKDYEAALAYISKALSLHPNFKAGLELKDAIRKLMENSDQL